MLQVHGAQVQSLVGELKAHISHGVAKKWPTNAPMENGVG